MNSKYFANEKVNTGRQPELDLLKAIAVFGMIVIHVFLDLGKNVMPTAVDDYFTFLFGADIFMICMGIGMCYMRKQTPASYLMRGIGLLTIGQFLNILRNSIPNLIAYWITGKQFFIANSLLVLQSDILSFAGLAFLLIALFKVFHLKNRTILGIGVALNLTSLILWNTVAPPQNYLVSQLVGYFIITDAEAYFPLFCYFIFVAFGLFVGEYYPRIKDKHALANRVMAICFPVSAVLFILRLLFESPYLPVVGSDTQYNMQATPEAIAGCIFTLALIALLYRITEAVGDRMPKIIYHLSANINSYYCVSYLLILPVQTLLIALTGKVFPGVVIPVLYALFVVVACYFLIEWNNKYWHIHPANLRGTKLIIFVAATWIATVLIVVYAYPRIEEFANVWNEYLLP